MGTATEFKCNSFPNKCICADCMDKHTSYFLSRTESSLLQYLQQQQNKFPKESMKDLQADLQCNFRNNFCSHCFGRYHRIFFREF
jgi:hypothetical protein